MNRLGHGRLRRITAEFRGDEAVELEILEVSLRMGEVARTRIEADTRLLHLAFKALDNVIAEYCRANNARSGVLSGRSRHSAWLRMSDAVLTFWPRGSPTRGGRPR